jgi:hypothetical protein
MHRVSLACWPRLICAEWPVLWPISLSGRPDRCRRRCSAGYRGDDQISGRTCSTALSPPAGRSTVHGDVSTAAGRAPPGMRINGGAVDAVVRGGRKPARAIRSASVKTGWIVASAAVGAAVVIGHLPARLEPGSWANPGPSGSTETQRKPSGQVTLCRQRTSSIGRQAARETPYRRLGAARSCARPCRGCLQIVQLWTSLHLRMIGPGEGRSGLLSTHGRFGAVQPVGWGIWTLVRGGGSPGMLTWGKPAGLCRCLDEVMVALFRAWPVAGPAAGRGLAGRPVGGGRRVRGWAAAGWLGRVRRRSRLPRRARRTPPRRAGRH